MKNKLSEILGTHRSASLPLLLAVLAAAFLMPAVPALAQGNTAAIQNTPYRLYSASTTNAATTLSYAVIGANSINQGTPVVQSIDVLSDKLTGKLQFYKVDAIATATGANSTTRLDVRGTNGLADNGTILIRHMASDTYEKRTLTTSTGATNLVVTVAPLTALVLGDMIYHVTTTGAGFFNLVTNTVSANTMKLNLQGAALYAGQPGMPLLCEVDGNAAATVNQVTARFDP